MTGSEVTISEAPPTCIVTVPMIVADGHGGHVGITTHRNVPKCPKMQYQEDWGKKVLGQGRSGHQKVTETQVFFFFGLSSVDRAVN